MKNLIRIWLTALLYQTIIITANLKELNTHPKAFFALIAVEVIGSLPGLFVFLPAMSRLKLSKANIKIKWVYAMLITMSTSFGTILLTYIFLGGRLSSLRLEDLYHFGLAPLVALAALLTFCHSTTKYLKNSTANNTSEM